MIFSVCFNAIVFRDLSAEAYNRGIIVAIILPILLAGPLFFFVTLKLRELSRLNHRLNNAVSIDHLTRLLNRGAFADAAKTAIKLLGRGGRSDSTSNLFLVIDIDHFKKVNDEHGHPVGDQALKDVAKAFKNAVRDHDLVGRLGGEEFGLLLTHVVQEDAYCIVDRIRKDVSSIHIMHNGKSVDLTVSIGGVVFSGDMDFDALYKAADVKLYEAKQSGRNTSVLGQMDHLGRIEKIEEASPALPILRLATR